MIKRKRSDLENSCSTAEDLKLKCEKILVIKEKLQYLLSEYLSKFLNCYKLENLKKEVFWLEEELEKLKIFDNELKYLCEINNDAKEQCANLISDLSEITNKFFEFKEQFNFDLRFIYYFNYRNTKKSYFLGLYDAEVRKWNKINIDFTIQSYSRSCFTQLPNSKLFYYYENLDMNRGNCYIIDLKSFSIKENLPSIPKLTSSVCIYYGNFIYIFGKPLALKLDLLKNKWYMLPPILSKSTMCLEIYKNSILIAGSPLLQIFKYDIEIESYSVIDLKCPSTWGCAGIISWDLRAYVFVSNGFIHESEIDNEYVWQKIGKFSYRFLTIPFKKYSNGSVFMTVTTGYGLRVHRFDLKSKGFKMLREIKYA